LLLDPSEEFTGVPAIGPDEFKARKALFAPGEHKLGSVAILNMGAM